ncbi:MAG: sialate O-acetylesterase [Lentisphaerae bacterium]|nr:sialate O-acetylesterase [Lentisphaerota bacterium]
MDLKLTLQNGAVLQRNQDNVSEHDFSGSCSSTGKVFLTVTADRAVCPGFDRIECGFAARKRLQGTVRGLPVGGPYTLTLQIGSSGEKAVFKDIYVGDLWLLAGQSNMADSGFMPSLCQQRPEVRAFYMQNVWGIAQDPLHDVIHAAAPVHGGNPNNPPVKRLRGTGPGLPFGLAMYEATGVPQGLIACAHGGTSLAQWDPALKKQGGNSLYGALYERLQNLGGRVAGVLWYQGCNETGTLEKSQACESTTRKLFAALRRDCRNRNLPIVFAQLGSYIANADADAELSRRWIIVRHGQYMLGQKLKNTACVPTIDLELDDAIHLSNHAVPVLGRRMAQAMLSLTGQGEKLPPITVGRSRCFCNKLTNCARIELTFNNVCGQLQASSLPCGFGVVDKDGRWVCEAINVRLDGNRVIINTVIPYWEFADNCRIVYGGSLQPHANITDGAGRSLPCFMLDIKNENPNISPMLSQALVSEAIFGDDSFEALKLPQNMDQLNFKPAEFVTFYLKCPREAGELDSRSKLYCYKFRARAVEDMQVKMLLGADAAFLVFCDGTQIMRQYASNPVIPDEFEQELFLSAGEHEFVIVFSSNSGHGWGVCCRFSRIGALIYPEVIDVDKWQ